jgi:GGDEF domain-containing protein
MMTQNARTIAQQQELIHKLSWNDAFGCHTRAGFEHMVWPQIAARTRYILYFDINGMHALNESFGSYGPVDEMIKTVLGNVRSTDYACGQVKSGDEFLVALVESEDRQTLDPEGLRDRLIAEFAKVGMSAMFSIVPVRSTDLMENLLPAIEDVYEQKKARGSTSR